MSTALNSILLQDLTEFVLSRMEEYFQENFEEKMRSQTKESRLVIDGGYKYELSKEDKNDDNDEDKKQKDEKFEVDEKDEIDKKNKMVEKDKEDKNEETDEKDESDKKIRVDQKDKNDMNDVNDEMDDDKNQKDKKSGKGDKDDKDDNDKEDKDEKNKKDKVGKRDKKDKKCKSFKKDKKVKKEQGFLYESMTVNQGKESSNWTYDVPNSTEFCKLYMKSFMAKSIDVAYLLTIIKKSSHFSPDLTDLANDVYTQVRNPLSHQHLEDWDNDKRHQSMEKIISLADAIEADEEVMDELRLFRDKHVELLPHPAFNLRYLLHGALQVAAVVFGKRPEFDLGRIKGPTRADKREIDAFMAETATMAVNY